MGGIWGARGRASGYAGVAANNTAIGTINWTSLLNAQGPPTANVAATSGPAPSYISRYIYLSGYGFSLASGVTINGVTVSVSKIRPATATVQDASVRLFLAGSAAGSDKATGTAWPTALTVVTVGGPADLWGISLTTSDVNASSFGVGIASSVAAVSPPRGSALNGIKITIDYTL